MGKGLGIFIAVIATWGALAQIMPGTFQITRERHGKLMSVAFGSKSIWFAVIAVGCLQGWYVWNLEGRLSAISGTNATVSVQQDETGLNFMTWTADQSSCSAQIDTSKIPASMRDQFDIALVCGFADPATDQLKDTRITISHLFTVQSPLQIAAPFSTAMADALAKEQDAALKKIQPSPPKGTTVSMQNTIWMKMALIRKGFDTSNIHKLEDVSITGGKISDRGAGVAIIRNVTIP